MFKISSCAAIFFVFLFLHSICATSILIWELCEQSRCANCTINEGFRCWRAVKGENYLKDVAVCLHYSIDPNERMTPEPKCMTCQRLTFLAESNARIEQCIDKIVKAHQIVLAEKETSICELDWVQRNTVYVTGGLQVATCLVALFALYWAVKCQRTVTVTKYVYKRAPPMPNSPPPAVFDLHHYDEPNNS